jgi:hypothetical protein
MDWQATFDSGLGYADFLAQYGKPEHRDRWAAFYDQAALNAEANAVLGGFVRRMNVFCLAGTWCGDCVNQCPILQRMAEACDLIDLRFADRDASAELREALSVNGGHRVPVVVFLSEDFHECGRYGERTVSTYRHLAKKLLGAACPTGIGGVEESLLAAVTREWLTEFERMQLMLRLSPRLRELHGD